MVMSFLSPLAVVTVTSTSSPVRLRGAGMKTHSAWSMAAPVTVYEMADFQCPACRQFTLTTFPAIDRDYIQTGKVRWVFVNFPLSSIHRNAVAAAQVGWNSSAAESIFGLTRSPSPKAIKIICGE